jgi:hypothetical protein
MEFIASLLSSTLSRLEKNAMLTIVDTLDWTAQLPFLRSSSSFFGTLTNAGTTTELRFRNTYRIIISNYLQLNPECTHAPGSLERLTFVIGPSGILPFHLSSTIVICSPSASVWIFTTLSIVCSVLMPLTTYLLLRFMVIGFPPDTTLYERRSISENAV